MSDFNESRGWRGRLGRLAGELVVVFVGVSAAFVVENYRDSRNQAAEFHQTLLGVISELADAETRGGIHVDAIRRNISAWETADKNGEKAIPGYYRIPGAPHPPAAAWNTMVASGLARLIEPRLRTELGYYYSEFVGIHDNYDRYNQFTEREVLPRALSGPDAFYGPDGHLLPQFHVHMELQREFANDLAKAIAKAHDLRMQLQAAVSSK